MTTRPRRLFRTILVAASTLVGASAGLVYAEPTAEQLKAMYEESQRQLQQSQDRKNELANENEQLRARLGELESQLRSITFQAQQAQFLRNQFAVWASFMQQYPALLKRFETYLSGEVGLPQSAPTAHPLATPFFDPHWPFSAVSQGGLENL